MSVEQRLKELGITLPQVGAPIGNYVHAKRTGNLLYLSGKGPPEGADGKMPKGKLGAGMSIEEGYGHARQVGLVLIAAMTSSRCSAWSMPRPISRITRRWSTAAPIFLSRCSATAAATRARPSA